MTQLKVGFNWLIFFMLFFLHNACNKPIIEKYSFFSNEEFINLNYEFFYSTKVAYKKPIEGYWTIKNDTLYYAIKNFKNTYNIFPFLIFSDTNSISISAFYGYNKVSCVNNYNITITKKITNKDDTVYIFTHNYYEILKNESYTDSGNTLMENISSLKKTLKDRDYIFSTKYGFLKYTFKTEAITNEFNCFPYDPQ